jgi:hypothetical protein
LLADKNNKREHRGFGFVTFETEAAIQRVVAHGPHTIRGSIVAIDSAVPRQVRAGLTHVLVCAQGVSVLVCVHVHVGISSAAGARGGGGGPPPRGGHSCIPSKNPPPPPPPSPPPP